MKDDKASRGAWQDELTFEKADINRRKANSVREKYIMVKEQ